MLRQFCSVKLKSSKLMVCLSLITIFILIVATVTIVTVIAKTPIIILALGQAQAGQIDLSITTVGSANLNNTRIRELTQQNSMPRIEVSGVRFNEIYGTGWLMDFQAENRNQLGHYGHDIAANQVFMHDSFGFHVGDIVEVEMPVFGASVYSIVDFLQQNGPPQGMSEQNFNATVIALKSLWRLFAPFRVVGTFATSQGKFREGDTAYYAYFNINNMLPYIIGKSLVSELNATQTIQECMVQLLSNVRQQDYANIVIFNMPNRTEVYGEVNFDIISEQVNLFSGAILEKLGIYAVQPSQPILYLLSRMSYFGMFIGVILKLIVFSLFCLSVLMMYNMMMIGVESKNFDFGMLRTVGMNRNSLMLAVLVDSLKYVVVANLMGFPVSYGTLKIVSSIFTKFFGFDYVLKPTFDSVVIAAVVGFLVPMVASFVPIRVALSEKIIESINPIRNKTVAIKHETYIEGRQFPVSRFLFGVLSWGIGFMIFYLLPQSLVDQNVGLLLIIFFALLIGLLLGLVILTYSFQYLLERGVAYLTLFWLKAADLSLVIKNLSAHREKNRRAALLYSLSVSFIVFVSVGISIQIQTIYNELLKQHSCYLQVNNQNYRGLDRLFYDELIGSSIYKPYIKDYSYVTYSLQDHLSRMERVQSIQVSDKARQFFLNNDIYGISPNFLKTLYFQNFDVSQTLSKKGLDPVEYLYTNQGQNTCIVSQYLAEKLSIDVQGNNQFLLALNWPMSSHRFVKNVSSVFTKAAGIPFSSFMFLPSSIAVSLETYAELANLPSLNQVPYQKIKIQLFNPKESSKVANQLRRDMAQAAQSDSVWDYAELTTTINDIESLLTKIFLILLAVVLIISFFSLLTTASTNILNQTKEISILLGLGLSKNRITGIYIYEAFALVLTACLIGIFVGSVLAVLMGMQRELFGDFPVEVNISGVWIIVGTAVLSAVASTLGTIRRVLNHRVADILKMT